MIDNEEEGIGCNYGPIMSTTEQQDYATDPQPFVAETVQSRWVLEFFRGVRLRIEEGQCEFEVSSAESRLPSRDPGPITEEELAFGGNVGFPMERHPAEY